MIVCIAEKQSQAQNIAQVLGQLIIIHESLRNWSNLYIFAPQEPAKPLYDA